MVGAAQLIVAAAAAIFAVGTSAAQPFTAQGHCRDGQAHGNYELRDAQGKVRAVGAYNRGKRAGSFIFWSSEGVRIAHLPFDEDALSGTLALWYSANSARDPQRKLEAVYAHGKLHGGKRSWYPDGRLRAEYRYENGALREASATSESGKAMTDAAARAQALRDAATDEAFVASLLGTIAANPPRCDGTGDKA